MLPTKNNWVLLGLRCHRWFMRKMGLEIGTTLERVFLGLALAGETGELANLIKKLWRDQWKMNAAEKDLLLAEIHAEMADVNGYLHHLANSFKVDLDEITAQKTSVLMVRWPEAFEPPEETLNG